MGEPAKTIAVLVKVVYLPPLDAQHAPNEEACLELDPSNGEYTVSTPYIGRYVNRSIHLHCSYREMFC